MTIQNGPYFYHVGPNTLGIGIDNMALIRPHIPVDPYQAVGPRYNVRRAFSALLGGGQFPLAVFAPTVDIKANGVYLSGTIQLQALSNFNAQNNLT